MAWVPWCSQGHLSSTPRQAAGLAQLGGGIQLRLPDSPALLPLVQGPDGWALRDQHPEEESQPGGATRAGGGVPTRVTRKPPRGWEGWRVKGQGLGMVFRGRGLHGALGGGAAHPQPCLQRGSPASLWPEEGEASTLSALVVTCRPHLRTLCLWARGRARSTSGWGGWPVQLWGP